MSYTLSSRSLARLIGVHPDLSRIVSRAIEVTPTDFSVVEGVRTLAKQREYFMKGKSQTMRSRHLTGHAVDLAPWVNGTIDWTPVNFRPVANAMKRSAAELGVPLEWGGDWRSFIDFPHFQLPWGAYP